MSSSDRQPTCPITASPTSPISDSAIFVSCSLRQHHSMSLESPRSHWRGTPSAHLGASAVAAAFAVTQICFLATLRRLSGIYTERCTCLCTQSLGRAARTTAVSVTAVRPVDRACSCIVGSRFSTQAASVALKRSQQQGVCHTQGKKNEFYAVTSWGAGLSPSRVPQRFNRYVSVTSER